MVKSVWNKGKIGVSEETSSKLSEAGKRQKGKKRGSYIRKRRPKLFRPVLSEKEIHRFCRHKKRGRPVKEIPGYVAVHTRLRLSGRKIGICSKCGAAPGPHGPQGTQNALIHGQGVHSDKRRIPYSTDPNDYIELCPACHIIYDRK